MAQWERTRLPMQETQVPSLRREDLPEEEMATHSSILAWRIPWTEEPGRLQSMKLQKSTIRLSIHNVNLSPCVGNILQRVNPDWFQPSD